MDSEESDQRPKSSQCLAFAATFAAKASLLGIIGAYSIVKTHLNKEKGVEEDFLGIVDAVCIFGRFLGIIYHLIKPPENPKTRYLIYSIFLSASLCLVPAISFFPNLLEVTLIIVMLVTGFARSAYVLPVFLVNQYFDARDRREQAILGIWVTSAGIRDVLGLAVVYSFINYVY